MDLSRYFQRLNGIAELDIDEAALRFQDAFRAVRMGQAENDGLNRLVLAAGLDWHQNTVVRCYAKYLLQLTIPFSQDYMENVLVSHAGFVRDLVRHFELQFDPSIGKRKRREDLEHIRRKVRRSIGRARNLDEDRILSAFAGAVRATLRTNYFQFDEEGNRKG